MRKNYPFLILLLLLFNITFINGYAQNSRETINIDFGSGSQRSPAPWNNISDPNAGAVANLTTDQGYLTGISIAITSPFNAMNNVTATADDTLGIHPMAATDNFYGNTSSFGGKTVPMAVLTISNLDVTKAYSFAFFGNRASVSENRETLYTVEGLTNPDPVALNVSSNTSKMVRVSNVMPKEDGTITVVVEKGPNNRNSTGFYHISAMKISYVNTVDRGPKAVTVKYPNGAEEIKAGREISIAWERNDVASVNIDYSTDNGANWQSIAKSVPAMVGTYKWMVPSDITERALVRISDSEDPTIKDESDQPFTIFQSNGKQYTIVVLGSSTANGGGPSVKDSAWVWRYRNYLANKRSDFTVINLAVGGYNTASILPANNPDNNITKALSYNPDAIIINMPSNDAAMGRSVQDQMANYDIIAARAAQANVPLWVTTPQPRNFSQDKVQIQLGMIDATYSKFGEDFTVDFWTGFNTANNTMKPEYDSGDGVHMNDAAHRIMLERIIGENISGYL
ncbi:SGNH/GDSL hydrolase family protein, partial [Rufibacter roseus]